MTNCSLRRPHDQATGMPTQVLALRRGAHAMHAFAVVYLPRAGGANAPRAARYSCRAICTCVAVGGYFACAPWHGNGMQLRCGPRCIRQALRSTRAM